MPIYPIHLNILLVKGGFQIQVISYSVGVEDEPKHPSSPKELQIDGECRRNLLIVSIIAFGLLGVAFVLSPAKAGIGTHQQLGLPTCGLGSCCGFTMSNLRDDNSMVSYRTRAMDNRVFDSTYGVFARTCHGICGSLVPACCLYRTSISTVFTIRFANSKFFILVIGLAIVAWGFKILIHRGIL